MPRPTITLLGPRRFPAVAAPMGNGQSSISIFTSTGFQTLTTQSYEDATTALKPDIAIPLADLTPVSVTPKSKRALRMAERTEDWLAQWFKRLGAEDVLKPSNISVFAPVLPVTYSMQWEYLNRIAEDHLPSVSGLAIYDTNIISDFKDYGSLLPLPRLSLDMPQTPHEVLTQISLGVDIFLLPFLNATSDSGVALTFTFPAPVPSSFPSSSSSSSSPPPASRSLPLGIDMFSPEHQTSLAPLRQGCGCYTCTNHHRAYVHHLLRTREMLAWTLLQIHNHRVLSDFFRGVRSCLSLGPEAGSGADEAETGTRIGAKEEEEVVAGGGGACGGDGSLSFAAQRARFAAVYEEHLPAGTGEKPRARGYHFRSGGGEEKRNRRAWGKLGGGGGEAAGTGLETGVEGLSVGDGAGIEVERDVVQTPVVPDEDSGELDKKGFAEVERKGKGDARFNGGGA